ncbi:MAG: recombination-associated protein RdgC [Geobacter sp.]|nr:recombination-associated protein RdgC [Geobacter sp.]
MGILSNTVSICQFKVVGELPATDLFQWVSERLAKNGFTPIDQGAAELSVGWVHLDDHRDSSFAAPAIFWRDNYLTFTLRQDRRLIPAALLRAHQKVAEDDYIAANPGYSRVPKQKREELREAVRGALLAKILPIPSTYDMIWDTRSNILTLATLGTKAVDLFETHFRKSFEGLRLIAVHPYARAGQVAEPQLVPALEKANKATTDAVLDLIKSNQWIGWDFLLWVMYRTLNESSEYRVTRPGPALDGEAFVAYLDDRMVLCATAENGVQKITASGPQDRFGEVQTALRNGKRITEAALYLEKGEDIWKMTLKGEMFHFASYKAPKVKEERDNTVEETSEKEALFYERMYVMETGLQLFDSLYAAFLAARLGDAWEAEVRKIEEWLGVE